MRKSDDDWVNKCMGFRVEGRSPVGRRKIVGRECGSRYGQIRGVHS